MTTNKRKRELSESIFREVLCERLECYSIQDNELKELAETCIKAIIIFEEVSETLLGPRAEDCHLEDYD